MSIGFSSKTQDEILQQCDQHRRPMEEHMEEVIVGQDDVIARTSSSRSPRKALMSGHTLPRVAACTLIAFASAVAAAETPVPAPLSHWTFDEPDGGEARDAVGGHHGIVHGAKPHARGVLGGGRLFVRKERHFIEVPYHGDFDIPSFTVSAWIWLTEPPTYSGILGTRQGGEFTFDMKVNANQVHGDIGNGDSWIQTAVNFGADDVGADGQGGRLQLGRWYLVTYVVDDAMKECRLYLNGDCKKTIPYKGTPRLMKPGQKLQIGSTGANEFMDGVIDDVKIWNRPLAAEQVRSLARP